CTSARRAKNETTKASHISRPKVGIASDPIWIKGSRSFPQQVPNLSVYKNHSPRRTRRAQRNTKTSPQRAQKKRRGLQTNDRNFKLSCRRGKCGVVGHLGEYVYQGMTLQLAEKIRIEIDLCQGITFSCAETALGFF